MKKLSLYWKQSTKHLPVSDESEPRTELRCARLTWIALVPGNFLEAVVERQVVAHGVPPAGIAATEKRELLHQVVIDLCQSEAAAAGLSDGHGDQGDVGVRGLRSAGVGLPFAAIAALCDRCRAVGYAVSVRTQLVSGQGRRDSRLCVNAQLQRLLRVVMRGENFKFHFPKKG